MSHLITRVEDAKMAVAVAKDTRECREFILKSLDEDGDTFLEVILSKPNVSESGVEVLKYTFGSTFPGEREGEEFVILRYKKGIVDPIHCTITVNEEGQYWIENAVKDQGTSKRKKKSPTTFVNKEKLEGPRRLEVGDIICLGRLETECTSRRPRPVFHVQERNGKMNRISSPKPVTKLEESNAEPTEDDEEAKTGIVGHAVPPLEIGLILSNIMGYLPINDLKTCRQVSSKWKEEASKALGKRASVNFSFGMDYLKPSNSMKVFRYLHEVQDVKPRELRVSLEEFNIFRFSNFRSINPPLTPHNNNPRLQNPLLYTSGEPGSKILADIRKLLNSPHNFSSLSLQSAITRNTDFLPFRMIFQKIGEKLMELKLMTEINFLPDPIPPFPVMSNLKKFTDRNYDQYLCRNSNSYKKLTLHFVPLFRTTLEDFCCTSNIALYYLEELLQNETPRLHGITIEGTITSAILSLLLNFKSPLTLLKLGNYEYYDSEKSEPLLEKLLLKNSTTLKTLVLEVYLESYLDNVKKTEIKFPKFPNLEELDLTYRLSTKITWEPSLNYKEHFPSLKKLKLTPRLSNTFEWDKDNVFNTFFPEESDTVFKTLRELEIPVIMEPESIFRRSTPNQNVKMRMLERYNKFQKRVDKIKEMFPKVENFREKDVGFHNIYDSKCSGSLF